MRTFHDTTVTNNRGPLEHLKCGASGERLVVDLRPIHETYLRDRMRLAALTLMRIDYLDAKILAFIDAKMRAITNRRSSLTSSSRRRW